MPKKKKRSFLAEIDKVTTKSPQIDVFTLLSDDKSLFQIKPSPKIFNNSAKHLVNLEKVGNSAAIQIASYLNQADSIIFNPEEFNKFLSLNIEPKFSNFLANYSELDQKFLIVSFLRQKWIELIEIILEEDLTKLSNLIQGKRDKLFLGWSYYQIFKKYLPELEIVFAPLWSSIETILFQN